MESVLVEREELMARVILNRPAQLNVLNAEIFKHIYEVFEDLEKDKKCKVIILTGSGEKAFAAGTDVREMVHLNFKEARNYALLAKRAVDKVALCTKPVIAAVNGYALGGGLELALACDLRIASDNAKFGQVEINVGVIPGSGGTQRLPRLVGMGRAKEMIFTAQVIDAYEAYRIGLVNKVVPAENLQEEANKLARKIAEKSGVALALAKRALNAGVEMSLSAALDYEIECFALCFASNDQKEGMRAFLEKRLPKFEDIL